MRLLASRVLSALVALGLGSAVTPPDTASAARPEFVFRGVIEGPYGRPWDHGQRERVLRWMPAHGFDAYVHAPKDDLYGRTNWRDPYPAAQQSEFDAEIRLGRSLGVEWVPNISPALPLIPTPAPPSQPPSKDLCFSCPEDLDALLAKFEPFIAAGSRTVMVSFDDVSKVMSDPRDTATYGQGDTAFGRANGEVLTKLLGRLKERNPGLRLLMVGADYSGTADTAYLQGLRATLDPRVEVLWTGTNIPSENFSPDDARAYARHVGRKPIVWDNWTNNDASGNALSGQAARIFLGPYKRRADVAGELRGFFFNPTNEADLNLLPLATAGDWMRDPDSYAPEDSWLAAIDELAGPGGPREPLRAFAEASWSNKLDRELEAPTFGARYRTFLDRYRAGGRWPGHYAPLIEELRLAEGSDRTLARLPRREIFEQAAPFLTVTRQGAESGRLGTELLAAERPGLVVRPRGRGAEGEVSAPDPARAAALRAQFRSAVDEFRSNTRFAYGWRGGMAFDIPPYPVPGNVMDAFDDAVDELDRAWAPRSGEAAREVRLSLDGRPVTVDDAGRFSLGPEACTGELEAVDGAGGRTAVRLDRCAPAVPSPPPVLGSDSCLPRRLTLGRRGLGPVRLRRRLPAAVRPRARPVRRHVSRFCVRGGGQVLVVVGPARRVELVLSTARGHRVRGVRPGAPARAVRTGEPRRRPLARGFVLGGAGRLYELRARQLASVGRVSPRLVQRPANLRRALRRLRP